MWKWKSPNLMWLCNPMGCTVHGILQARILELVAVPFSRGSSQPRDQTWVSHIAGRFFTIWTTSDPSWHIMKPIIYCYLIHLFLRILGGFLKGDDYLNKHTFVTHLLSSVTQLCPTLCNPMDCTQAPLSMEFSRPGYWSGLPFPSTGDLPIPGIEPRSPSLQVGSLPAEPQWDM